MKNSASIKKIYTKTIRFIKNEKANVAIMTGFAIFILVAFGGAGVDLSRSQIIQQKMHQAADAAALAASIPSNGTPEAERTAIMHRYFELNFPPGFMGSTVNVNDLEIVYQPTGDAPATVNVQLASSMNTSFVNLVGKETINIGSETEVAVSQNAPDDIDVILVADTTGSMGMGTGRIEGLREASYALADSLLNPENLDPEDRVRMATIAYSAGGTERDYDDDGNPTGRATRAQGIKWDRSIDFTNDLTAVNASIASFNASGNTDGGYAAIIGRDRLLYNAPPRPEDGQVGASKAFIFLTDGEFNTPREEISEEDFTAACATLRAANVAVYTVKYGDAGNEAMLRTCASSPDNFYLVPNPDDLTGVFQHIVAQIKQIRITK